MNQTTQNQQDTPQWFAIRTSQETRAEKELTATCEELFFPKQKKHTPGKPPRTTAVIPKVLFVRTTPRHLLELEQQGKTQPELHVPFWIYRYPKSRRIQPIPPASISLLRLLTAPDSTRCEIYRKQDFIPGQRVRVTAGPFQGYEGTVHRIRKNKHVVVKIEGICLISLPFIHPDLLQEIN